LTLFLLQITPPAKQASPDTLPSSQAVEVGTPIQSPSLQPSPCPSEISVACSAATATDVSNYTLSFKIPSKWRPSIMKAIEEKKLTPDVRNEIVRDLVTHMYGYVEKPTTSFCKFVAQRLILKYPFMRDTKGTGYVSIDRVFFIILLLGMSLYSMVL